MLSAKQPGNSRGRYQASQESNQAKFLALHTHRRWSLRFLWVCAPPIPKFHCGNTLRVVVHKEGNGFTGNIQREAFVSWLSAQLCTSVSPWKDRVTGGTCKRLWLLGVLLNAADLIAVTQVRRRRTVMPHAVLEGDVALALSVHGCSQQSEVLKNTSGITSSSIWKLLWAPMRHSCLIIVGPYPLPLWSCQWPFNLLCTPSLHVVTRNTCNGSGSISFIFSPALVASSTTKQLWKVCCYMKRNEIQRK